jgi:hypothetical protein
MPVNDFRNSQGLPLFSQSLESQRLRQLPPREDKFFVPQAVLLTLPVLAIGALMFVARPNIAQTNKNAAKANAEKVAVTTQSGSNAADSDIALEPLEESGRRPLSFYTGGIRSNMFNAPQPPAPKPVVVKKPVIKVEKPPQTVVLPPVLPEINPFQDWAYTGVIKMGETRMALLENTKTKEGQYVKEGETILGSQVTSITDQSITLAAAGSSPRTLAKSETITVTPLNANAPYMSGGQPGQMPPGGMPQPMSGGAPMPMPMQNFNGNAGTVTLPNGRVLSTGQAERRNQWMNNNFRGGGGRGGRNR